MNETESSAFLKLGTNDRSLLLIWLCNIGTFLVDISVQYPGTILPGLVLVQLVFYLRKLQLNLPPGPLRLPIIGSLLTRRRDEPHFAYAARMKRRYGDIVSVHQGSQLVIYLNTLEVIQEAFVGQSMTFSGRPINAFLNSLNYRKGIVGTDGELFRTHRRFALRTLRDFGFAGMSSETNALDEGEAFCEEVERNQLGKPLNTTKLMAKLIAKVMHQICFSNKILKIDENLFDKYLDNLIALTHKESIIESLPQFFPGLMRIPLMTKLFGLGKRKKYFDGCYSFIRNIINSYTQPQDFSPRGDVISVYLTEQKQLDETVGSNNHTFDDVQILRVMHEIMAASTDTTSTTLCWALLLVAVHQDIQSKIHAELDEVIGDGRLNMSFKGKLYYLQAYIDEILRWSTPIPLALAHRVMQPTKLRGYDIPPDAMIHPNLYAVHHNPSLFHQPEKFDPERFIEDGVYKPNPNLVPFSIGKRICPAETMARMQLLLIFGTIMQKFTVQLANKHHLDTILLGTDGMVHGPGDHELVFNHR